MILFISATLCFSNNLLDVDGEDWTKWEIEYKFFFVVGFLTAHGALIQSAINSNLPDDIIDFLYFPENAETILMKVEYYYKTTNDLKTPIWIVIYFIYNKGWRNLKENRLPSVGIL